MKKPLNPEYTDLSSDPETEIPIPMARQKKARPARRRPQNKGKSISRRRQRKAKSASTFCQGKSMSSTKRRKAQSATPLSDHSPIMSLNDNLIDQTVQNHAMPNRDYGGTRVDSNQQAVRPFDNALAGNNYGHYRADNIQSELQEGSRLVQGWDNDQGLSAMPYNLSNSGRRAPEEDVVWAPNPDSNFAGSMLLSNQYLR